MESGAKLGPYEMIRELGRGGMGVVYLGRDTRLDREVAIKALPEHLAQDPERLARFEREAKTLAQLSHPNVAGIHGVEEHEGARYLVLEYVEGETLAERLDRGPFPIDEALEIAVQIAAGVEAAHEAGVIHRDLKPGNVIVTPEGKAKVLDFGLARSEESSSSTGASPTAATITSPAMHSPTMPGIILGTAAYMSPEQARGRRVDKRTDIWSFGVVLYEMLIGASPFIGETVSDSIGAVLHKDVDLDRLPPATPAVVRHVLKRCLTRDRSVRLRDIGDARIEIMRAAGGDAEDTAIGSARPTSSLAWGVAALFLAIAAYATWSAWLAPRPSAGSVIRSTIMPPEDTILVVTGDLGGPAVLSRDGSKIAFVARQKGREQRIFVRSLDGTECAPLRGTDGAMFPFWSWEGNSIAYFARGELKRFNLTTRTNRVICSARGGRGGVWLTGGRIVFAAEFQSPLSSVPEGGGTPTAITTLDTARHTSHRWPSPTPDGRSFIYSAVSHQSGRSDESAIFLHVEDGPDVEVTRAQFPGQIATGHLLVLREGTLYATPFDVQTGSLSGTATPIVEGVLGDLTTWYASFSAIQGGPLVFHPSAARTLVSEIGYGGPGGFGESTRSTIFRRDGRPARILAEGVPQNTTSISPDYTWLAISAAPDRDVGRTQFDIWIYPIPSALSEREEDSEEVVPSPSLSNEPPRRLTFLEGTEVSPQWSPDGKWIVFGSIQSKAMAESAGLVRIGVDGGQPETLLQMQEIGNANALIPTDWSSDGRYIIYVKGSWVSTQINDIFAFDLQTRESMPLVTTDGADESGRLSPDGKWLAYQSDDTGDFEVYVIPFAPGWEADREQGLPVPAEEAQWRISIAGGGEPVWRPDGAELYYIASGNSLIMVKVETDGPIFRHEPGSALFDAPSEAGVQYDVSPDGQRFIFNGTIEDQWTTISLISNWEELLRK